MRRIELPFTSTRSCLLVPPRAPRAGAPPLLVALHGQGQSGERHQRWLAEGLPPHFAAAFPDGFHAHEVRAPGRPIRLGHAWYLYTGDAAAFAASLIESEAALWRLVERAQRELGSDPRRLYLCGFSQGAYLAHCAAVRAADRVAGWVAQSGRLKHEFLGERLAGVAGLPVLIQHGERDESLPVAAAHDSAAILRRHGADVTLQLFDAGHRITPGMLVGLRSWLEERAR